MRRPDCNLSIWHRLGTALSLWSEFGFAVQLVARGATRAAELSRAAPDHELWMRSVSMIAARAVMIASGNTRTTPYGFRLMSVNLSYLKSNEFYNISN